MQLNRLSAPQIQIIKKIVLPAIDKLNLENGIPVFSVNTGIQEVVKIQLLFKAGIWYQSQSLEAFFTGQMLREGSEHFTASEIAEKLDSCGAFINCQVNRDNANVDIYTLNKHLETVLILAADMLKNPLFGEKELNRMRDQEKQEFIVRNQKVKHLAQKHFTTLLFGEKHPYGGSAEAKDYDLITPSLLRQFHSSFYGSGNCRIFVSGKIKQDTLHLVNKYFGQEKWGTTESAPSLNFEVITTSKNKHYIPKKGVVQSAIRMGNRSIGRLHPDYFTLSLVTTLFGGYFGSRLMSNIREDKGYTYGISAGIYPYLNDSSFMISSEVGSAVAQKAVNEIRYELKRLRTEKVNDEELNLVKNYMSGHFLRALNGSFAMGEVIKSLYENDLPEDFYQLYLDQIHRISPEDVQRMANQYLHEDQMIELIVGKK